MKFNHIEGVEDFKDKNFQDNRNFQDRNFQDKNELSTQEYARTLFADLEDEHFNANYETQTANSISEGMKSLDRVFNNNVDNDVITRANEKSKKQKAPYGNLVYDQEVTKLENVDEAFSQIDEKLGMGSFDFHDDWDAHAKDKLNNSEEKKEFQPTGLGLEEFARPEKKQNKKIIGSGSISVNPTRICVMGVGGGGVNATNMMVQQKIHGVDIVAANTDGQTLNTCLAENLLPLGHNLAGGLGSGGDPNKGAEAARAARKDISDWVKQYDMLFLAAGLGGGTGTGATPIIAEIAKEAGVLTVGVVTLPFSYEGSQRIIIAERGLEELETIIDALLVIPNDNITQNDFASHEIGVQEGFKIVDNVLANTVRSISEIITIPSLINVDFADIKSCLSGAGRIAVGFGCANSEERKSGNAHRAVETALKNTVISHENIEIMRDANHIIVNTIAGPEVSLNDYTAISDMIVSRVNAGGNHSFKHGYRVEATWGKKVQVTIIASHREMSDDLLRVEKNGYFHSRVNATGNYRRLPQQEQATHQERGAGSVDAYTKSRSGAKSEKEVLRVESDYVKNDVFEQLLEKNNFEHKERDILESEMEHDQYNTPAVNRLLGISDEPMVETRVMSTSAHSDIFTTGGIQVLNKNAKDVKH